MSSNGCFKWILVIIGIFLLILMTYKRKPAGGFLKQGSTPETASGKCAYHSMIHMITFTPELRTIAERNIKLAVKSMTNEKMKIAWEYISDKITDPTSRSETKLDYREPRICSLLKEAGLEMEPAKAGWGNVINYNLIFAYIFSGKNPGPGGEGIFEEPLGPKGRNSDRMYRCLSEDITARRIVNYAEPSDKYTPFIYIRFSWRKDQINYFVWLADKYENKIMCTMWGIEWGKSGREHHFVSIVREASTGMWMLVCDVYGIIYSESGESGGVVADMTTLLKKYCKRYSCIYWPLIVVIEDEIKEGQFQKAMKDVLGC